MKKQKIAHSLHSQGLWRVDDYLKRLLLPCRTENVGAAGEEDVSCACQETLIYM